MSHHHAQHLFDVRGQLLFTDQSPWASSLPIPTSKAIDPIGAGRAVIPARLGGTPNGPLRKPAFS